MASRPAAGGGDGDLLPDLDQAVPSRLAVVRADSRGRTKFFLIFASAVENVGAGPLLVSGSRAGRATPGMRVAQTVLRKDGSRRRIPLGASIRYVRAETHQHWHLLRFDRYGLRRADGTPVGTDRKTGFCLGDRYRARDGLPGQPKEPVLTVECGRGLPGLLSVREGISVGYGDDYHAGLEGQRIEVTGLPAGRYLLVHRVNAGLGLLQANPANDAASVLFALVSPAGPGRAPTVHVLARCPDTATCSAR